MTQLTPDQIFQGVQAVLVDALGVDEEEVTRDANIQTDLGAASIDYLDIVIRLERQFGFKVNRAQLSTDETNGWEWEEEGRQLFIRPAVLQTHYPWTNLDALQSVLRLPALPDRLTPEQFEFALTVDNLCLYVAHRQSQSS